MNNKILLWFKQRKKYNKIKRNIYLDIRDEHYRLRKYYPKKNKNKQERKLVNIAIFTINMNHAKIIREIIINELYNHKKYNIKKLIRNNLHIRFFIHKKEYNIKFYNINEPFIGENFNKIFVYEPVLYNDNLHTIVIPCSQRYCSKRDVFIIPNREEEVILKWIK